MNSNLSPVALSTQQQRLVEYAAAQAAHAEQLRTPATLRLAVPITESDTKRWEGELSASSWTQKSLTFDAAHYAVAYRPTWLDPLGCSSTQAGSTDPPKASSANKLKLLQFKAQRLKSRQRLGVYKMKKEIFTALRDVRVLTITGPSGSGKSTQVPLIASELEMFKNKRIVVVKSNPVAAIMLAKRLREELGEIDCVRDGKVQQQAPSIMESAVSVVLPLSCTPVSYFLPRPKNHEAALSTISSAAAPQQLDNDDTELFNDEPFLAQCSGVHPSTKIIITLPEVLVKSLLCDPSLSSIGCVIVDDVAHRSLMQEQMFSLLRDELIVSSSSSSGGGDAGQRMTSTKIAGGFRVISLCRDDTVEASLMEFFEATFRGKTQRLHTMLLNSGGGGGGGATLAGVRPPQQQAQQTWSSPQSSPPPVPTTVLLLEESIQWMKKGASEDNHFSLQTAQRIAHERLPHTTAGTASTIDKKKTTNSIGAVSTVITGREAADALDAANVLSTYSIAHAFTKGTPSFVHWGGYVLSALVSSIQAAQTHQQQEAKTGVRELPLVVLLLLPSSTLVAQSESFLQTYLPSFFSHGHPTSDDNDHLPYSLMFLSTECDMDDTTRPHHVASPSSSASCFFSLRENINRVCALMSGSTNPLISTTMHRSDDDHKPHRPSTRIHVVVTTADIADTSSLTSTTNTFHVPIVIDVGLESKKTYDPMQQADRVAVDPASKVNLLRNRTFPKWCVPDPEPSSKHAGGGGEVVGLTETNNLNAQSLTNALSPFPPPLIIQCLSKATYLNSTRQKIDTLHPILTASLNDWIAFVVSSRIHVQYQLGVSLLGVGGGGGGGGGSSSTATSADAAATTNITQAAKLAPRFQKFASAKLWDASSAVRSEMPLRTCQQVETLLSVMQCCDPVQDHVISILGICMFCLPFSLEVNRLLLASVALHDVATCSAVAAFWSLPAMTSKILQAANPKMRTYLSSCRGADLNEPTSGPACFSIAVGDQPQWRCTSQQMLNCLQLWHYTVNAQPTTGPVEFERLTGISGDIMNALCEGHLHCLKLIDKVSLLDRAMLCHKAGVDIHTQFPASSNNTPCRTNQLRSLVRAYFSKSTTSHFGAMTACCISYALYPSVSLVGSSFQKVPTSQQQHDAEGEDLMAITTTATSLNFVESVPTAAATYSFLGLNGPSPLPASCSDGITSSPCFSVSTSYAATERVWCDKQFIGVCRKLSSVLQPTSAASTDKSQHQNTSSSTPMISCGDLEGAIALPLLPVFCGVVERIPIKHEPKTCRGWLPPVTNAWRNTPAAAKALGPTPQVAPRTTEGLPYDTVQAAPEYLHIDRAFRLLTNRHAVDLIYKLRHAHKAKLEAMLQPFFDPSFLLHRQASSLPYHVEETPELKEAVQWFMRRWLSGDSFLQTRRAETNYATFAYRLSVLEPLCIHSTSLGLARPNKEASILMEAALGSQMHYLGALGVAGMGAQHASIGTHQEYHGKEPSERDKTRIRQTAKLISGAGNRQKEAALLQTAGMSFLSPDDEFHEYYLYILRQMAPHLDWLGDDIEQLKTFLDELELKIRDEIREESAKMGGPPAPSILEAPPAADGVDGSTTTNATTTLFEAGDATQNEGQVAKAPQDADLDFLADLVGGNVSSHPNNPPGGKSSLDDGTNAEKKDKTNNGGTETGTSLWDTVQNPPSSAEVNAPKAHPLTVRPPLIPVPDVPPPPSVYCHPVPKKEGVHLEVILAKALGEMLDVKVGPTLVVGQAARITVPSRAVEQRAIQLGKFRCLGEILFIERNDRIVDNPSGVSMVRGGYRGGGGGPGGRGVRGGRGYRGGMDSSQGRGGWQEGGSGGGGYNSRSAAPPPPRRDIGVASDSEDERK